MTKIGDAKEVLAGAIRDEFGDFRASVEELAAQSSELAADSAGINGVSSFWRSMNQQLQSMASTIADKQTDVLAALSGKAKHDIRSTLDKEQTERVKAAREDSERKEAADHAA